MWGISYIWVMISNGKQFDIFQFSFGDIIVQGIVSMGVGNGMYM